MRSVWLVFVLGGVALACGGRMRETFEGPSTSSQGGASTTTTGGQYVGSCRPDCGPHGGAGATAVAGAGGVGTAGAGTAGQSTIGLPSSGCGLDLPAEQVPTMPGTRAGYTEFFVNQTGAGLGADQPSNAGPRQFYVRVPADYDKNRPYRVVYVLHGCGAVRAGSTATYPLFDERQGGEEQAVYVALSIPDNNVNGTCYDNNTGADSQEWEAFDLIHTFVEARYCVDNDRIFVAGYSSGGWVSNMLGCYFAGTPSPPLDAPDVMAGRMVRKFLPRWAVRGHAVVAGALPPNQPVPCNGPAAGLWIHDELDKGTLIENDINALELALKSNGCQGNYREGPKEPWAPAEDIDGLRAGVCQRYTGCPSDILERYPLVFCTTQGLARQDQAPRFIPAFEAFAKGMDPKP